jgi:predicted ATPase
MHDRGVQQAVLFNIPGRNRKNGFIYDRRLLLQGSSEAQRQERIFDIVNHLNSCFAGWFVSWVNAMN